MTSSVAVADASDPTKAPPANPATEIRIDRTAKRIRVHFGGEMLADTINARLGYATGLHPEYLVPSTDVTLAGAEIDEAEAQTSPWGRFHVIRTAGSDSHRATIIGRHYVDGPAAGLVSFDFEAMDAWFEEDEQIWFHPRDPYRRVDVTESSRRLEIRVNGRTLARSDRPRLVTETGLPARWYVPRADVNWSRLTRSPTSSGCQYKGIADWWHIRADGSDPQLADVVWGYERPVPEAAKLAGLVAFYAEHAAVETYLDGVVQASPILDATALNPSLNLHNSSPEG